MSVNTEQQIGEGRGVLNVTSIQAYSELQTDPKAVLLDVRTENEWNNIGIPDLTLINKKLILVSWLTEPHMNINPNFLLDIEANINKENTIYILCRSGGRSLQAANYLQQYGFKTINIQDGMEGSHYSKGWKNNNLPWGRK